VLQLCLLLVDLHGCNISMYLKMGCLFDRVGFYIALGRLCSLGLFNSRDGRVSGKHPLKSSYVRSGKIKRKIVAYDQGHIFPAARQNDGLMHSEVRLESSAPLFKML
jgi:hypothetical protein